MIHASNHVATNIVGFNERRGIESGPQTLEAKRWTAAAGDVRDQMLETGADSVDAAKRLGTKTFDGAKSSTGKLSKGLAQRITRLRRNGAEPEDAGEEPH